MTDFLLQDADKKTFVIPAEAGIQRLKSLDSGQKHAGMTVGDAGGSGEAVIHLSGVPVQYASLAPCANRNEYIII